MENQKGKGDGAVTVKKSGITELLGKIKSLEQEVEVKNNKMRVLLATKEVEHERYMKKIKNLEDELEINKKAYQRIEENKEKQHQIDIKKLETELNVKGKFTDKLSANLTNLKRQLDAKEAENQQFREHLDKLGNQKSNDQNAQNELTKIKQNFAKLKSKHQKITFELSKYNAVPYFKEILTTKELLTKFEDKISKTKITPENLDEIEQQRQTYKAEIEKRKVRNEKLLENLKTRGVLTGDYHDEALRKLETQVQMFQQQNVDDIQTKFKKLLEIAQQTSELSEKLQKDIPNIVSEVVLSVKARENELNATRSNSFQQNFTNQEKKYKELIKKLDDEKVLFDSLLRNVLGTSQNKVKNVTGRAEDLLKPKEMPSCSKLGGMEKSLSDLKKECDTLFGKYYGGEAQQDLDKAENINEKGNPDAPTGWNFNFLDNKSEEGN